MAQDGDDRNGKRQPESDGETPEVEVLTGGQRPLSQHGEVILARDAWPRRLTIVPVTRPLFPKMTVPMVADDEQIRRVIAERARSESKFVGLVLETRNAAEDHERRVTAGDLHEVGVIAEILRVAEPRDDGPLQAVIAILGRFRIEEVVREDPDVLAQVHYIQEADHSENGELKPYALAVLQSLKELIALNPMHKEQLSIFLSHSSLDDPGRLADLAAAMTTAEPEELQKILEAMHVRQRLEDVLFLLKKEIDTTKLQAKINKQIEEKISKQQREFFLREQLKAIKKELGLAKEGKEAELERFEERLRDLNPPDEVAGRIHEEMEKLKIIEPASPEFNVSRNYVDWLTILPWGVFTDDNYDIQRAQNVLNADHYGLEDVKDRILEFLAAGIMKGNISGTILCFVGPPGVGKTSLGHSIARSIGREFYRFSVGGIRDEAEIKGHRRTYIGAMPGKFIQAMKTCGSANPVIMLDEIDKIGASYRGDPASALLEVLDPEQNREFLDHYLDVRFDLSNVFFICTANQMDTIPRPLLDRMEMIKLSGYIMEEKVQIARKFLIPKQLEQHGVGTRQVFVTVGAVRQVIDGYAREPGVRSLEKGLRRMIRKSVKRLIEDGDERIKIKAADVPALLGKRTFIEDKRRKKAVPGVAVGLAWTSMGGDTLTVEATHVETGKAGFKQTGQLGKVMVESSEIAYTYVRSLVGDSEASRDFFNHNFIHLHVPAGATPKDGPSAGITMASALYTLALDQKWSSRVAMTGELTLSGRVMPVGGIKEKTIAAKRAGLRELIFPSENRKDYEDIPEHIRKGLQPHFVETFEDVIAICSAD